MAGTMRNKVEHKNYQESKTMIRSSLLKPFRRYACGPWYKPNVKIRPTHSALWYVRQKQSKSEVRRSLERNEGNLATSV